MPMRRNLPSALLVLLVLVVPTRGNAQLVGGSPLAGDWVRVVSNNNPNDQMRITVSRTGASLTYVPAGASSSWRTGLAIWRAIQSNGSLEIRGSDGTYYPAQLAFVGPDEVRITIRNAGAGNSQTWIRAGPSIDGPWVRIASGHPHDGLQVQALGPQATIRYLPPTAARGLRIGSRLWQGIGSGGKLQVLGNGAYRSATITLLGPDSLRVDSNASSVGTGQIWVRPTAVASARSGTGLPRPVPNAAQPGSAPSASGPIAAPGAVPLGPTGACSGTSLPYDQMGISWRLGLSSPTRPDAVRENQGIFDYKVATVRRAPTNFLMDFERSRVPGMTDGFAFVWQDPAPRRRRWQRYSGLTSQGYANQGRASQNAGLFPHDFEAWIGARGTEYGGVWADNTAGLGWWADHDLTSAQYDQEYVRLSAAGYRPVDFEAYPTSAGVRYAAIWYKSCTRSNWRHTRDLDRTQYQSQVQALSALGFQLIDFEAYQTSAGQRYGAIWEQIPPGRRWIVRSDRPIGDFFNLHRRYEDEGLRLLDYESYQTSQGIRYAGVWVENDRRHDFAFKTAVDDTIRTYRTNHGIAGISVVVMRRNPQTGNGDVIYRRGFGWADSLQQKQAHSRTIYLTASVAKVFAGTLAGRLEDQGRLDLTRRTSDFLTYLSPQRTHTLEQLLSKTACVWHYPEGPEPALQYYRWRDSVLRQTVSWTPPPLPFSGRVTLTGEFRAFPLISGCQPGSDYRYSTHGFTFFGGALESALGKSIDQILREELVVPFRLPSLRVATDNGPLAGVPFYHKAQGYWYDSATVSRRPLTYENSTWKVLGGGLQIDARDLARFGWLTLDGAIADTTRLWTSLTANLQDITNGRNAPNVGLAWEVRQARDTGGDTINVAEHGGVARGARSSIAIYRDNSSTTVDGLIVAVLTNQRNGLLTPASGGSHPIWRLNRGIARAVLANLPPP